MPVRSPLREMAPGPFPGSAQSTAPASMTQQKSGTFAIRRIENPCCWCVAPMGIDYRHRDRPPIATPCGDREGRADARAPRDPRRVGRRVVPGHSSEAVPGLDRPFRTRRVDDVAVWSISCFYIRKGHRRTGIMTALIATATAANAATVTERHRLHRQGRGPVRVQHEQRQDPADHRQGRERVHVPRRAADHPVADAGRQPAGHAGWHPDRHSTPPRPPPSSPP